MKLRNIFVKETENQEEPVETKKDKKGLVALVCAAVGVGAYKLYKHLANKNTVESTDDDPFEGVDEPIEGLDLSETEE